MSKNLEVKDNLPANPFEGRDPKEVWAELGKKGKPVNKEEFLKRMEEQAEKNMSK